MSIDVYIDISQQGDWDNCEGFWDLAAFGICRKTILGRA